MKTQVNAYDHGSGLRDSVTVPFGRDLAICRLRKALGGPQYKIFTEDIAVYARIDVEPIVVHIFSCSVDRSAAAWDKIVSTLTRGVVT